MNEHSGHADRRLIDGIGLWAERLTETDFQSAAALFLDRDGVIVEETHYLGRAQDVSMIPGVAEAIAKINARGAPIVLVSNQAGIARGYYGWSDFDEVQNAICAALAEAGARLDLVLACGYHDVGSGPLSVGNHAWRKPNGGMLTFAAKQLGLDLARSWIIGDKASDLAAGVEAGLSGGALVRTGHGDSEIEQLAALCDPSRDRFVCRVDGDAAMAIDRLLSEGRF